MYPAVHPQGHQAGDGNGQGHPAPVTAPEGHWDPQGARDVLWDAGMLGGMQECSAAQGLHAWLPLQCAISRPAVTPLSLFAYSCSDSAVHC